MTRMGDPISPPGGVHVAETGTAHRGRGSRSNTMTHRSPAQRLGQNKSISAERDRQASNVDRVDPGICGLKRAGNDPYFTMLQCT